ncbi:MAG: EFR1 family ferrodoxin [Prolixibacteraceae bacterium]|nr:EFR1 family ferrodoxin [Prolixibacteraceae bacterium]
MNIEVYYFSGTGNSLYVACSIAEKINGTLIPIASVVGQSKIETTADVIGIVFPAYLAQHTGVPVMVEKFVRKLKNTNSRYVFAVCTCGGYENVNALPTLKNLGRIIRKSGGKLTAEFSVRLPMNNLQYPPYVKHDHDKMFSDSHKKIEDICKRIKKRKKNKHQILKSLLNLTMTPLYLMLKNLYVNDLKKKAKVSPDSTLSFPELIYLSDNSIFSTEACNGCGVCEKICPAGNIKIINDKPIWQNHCEMCMACTEWCPQQAVNHWNRKEGVTYHHPDVKLSDMLINLK